MTQHKDGHQGSSELMQLKPNQVHSAIYTTMLEYLNLEIMKNSPQIEL